MQKIAFLLSIIGSCGLFAQEETPTLKGLLVVDDASKVKEDTQVNGVQFDGINAPGGNQTLARELTPFLSDFPLTADGAKELCDTIATYYQDYDDLRVHVSIPQQDVASGVATVVVEPERVGEVSVKDNHYTKAEAVKKWVRLAPKDQINNKTVAQDLGWLNSNPYRTVTADFQPGNQPGVTNVDFLVADKKNWKVFSGVDNTGTNPIGPTRIYAGFNVNNFIFSDHTLNVQYTIADHFSEFQSYSAQYTAPLPWRNTLKISGSYTGTAPNRSAFPQKHRQNYQASTRYAMPYWFGSNIWADQVTLDVGADFKGMNTNILFEDDAAPVLKRLAYVGQFAGSLSALRVRGGSKITAMAEVVGSPMQMLPNQTDADYNNLREGATAQYIYSKFSFAVDQALPASWKLFFQGRSQFAFSNLIPSEQFALGGYSTVRGYDEKVVNGDNAVCANLELRAPSFPVAGIWMPKAGDSLTVLGFVDGGYAWFREAVLDTPTAQTLLGAGAGLRYNIASYFTSRLDVGFPLQTVEKNNNEPHIHFNAVLSY